MSDCGHDHEKSSIEEANGAASGFTGTLENWNADAETKLADVLFNVGKFVQGESGCLLGHIKAAVYVEDGKGITLNLIDIDNGVEHHGVLERNDLVKFNFMCAVLDVDEDELTHFMLHAIDDSGLDYHIDRSSLEHHHEHHHHHHDDDKECDCHEHEHEHGHHHHHDDDEECECHDHEHEHHHHHDDDDGCCECGHKDFSKMIDDNGKLIPHGHEHHHDHDEHESSCCHKH